MLDAQRTLFQSEEACADQARAPASLYQPVKALGGAGGELFPRSNSQGAIGMNAKSCTGTFLFVAAMLAGCDGRKRTRSRTSGARPTQFETPVPKHATRRGHDAGAGAIAADGSRTQGRSRSRASRARQPNSRRAFETEALSPAAKTARPLDPVAGSRQPTGNSCCNCLLAAEALRAKLDRSSSRVEPGYYRLEAAVGITRFHRYFLVDALPVHQVPFAAQAGIELERIARPPWDTTMGGRGNR